MAIAVERGIGRLDKGSRQPEWRFLADPGHWDGPRPDEANHSCHDAMQGPAARLHPRIEDRARAA